MTLQIRLYKLLLITGAILCFGVAGYAVYLPFIGMAGPIHTRLFALPKLFLYMHIVAGALALALIPIQFFLIKQYKYWHRKIGKLYSVAVVISCTGAYYLAWNAYGGLSSTVALSTLATLWWFVTFKAVFHALNGDIQQHKKWIIRSTALTASAITLRLLSPILYSFFDLYTAQQIIYWSCWPINLLLAEIYLWKLNLNIPYSK
ncbi:DUF2306 domain-containing protein [uncultured Paraglaciecola sp.]|mgnify:CR=1 FL=1|uniref:DUF2306 domain-containing protein n=1 Tax=uncultured Paraglaciecola sp. TaxID=1765024 RepID=UPI0030DB839B|tara:strand:+ start:354424 stop:355035 length:612 start_codon:yes stop_codon:yes gene_type:complete